jgi:hypothetical protein
MNLIKLYHGFLIIDINIPLLSEILQNFGIPHRQKCENPPSSSEDLKLKNIADLPEFMSPKSVRFKRDY